MRKSVSSLTVLAASLALSAGACAQPADDAGQATTAAMAEVSTITEGVLTIGSDIPFAPFEFEEGGQLTGFDVELAEEVAARLGLEPEWVDTAFDTIFTQLAAGQFDMVASATTITEERQQTVDFSIPYYRAQQALTVNSEETPDIQAVEDLGEGDSVAVQTGTTGESWAQENLTPNGVEVRSFPEAADTFTALEAGQVTGVIFDEPAAVDATVERPSLAVVATLDTDEEYGFPVNPENNALLEAVNGALQAMMDDGTYQEIYDKYFPDAPAGSILEG
jgi:polar amino acid transport system substrate-binding protein